MGDNLCMETNSGRIMSQNKKRPIYINIAGHYLLSASLLNKGSAFSVKERRDFNIEGLIPCTIETIDDQVKRAYSQFLTIDDDLSKHIYLRHIQDINETLFLRLVTQYIDTMLPLIYTPTVGLACQMFSQIYRNKRGLFLSFENRDHIDNIMHNSTKPKTKVIVITDSERILGLGDQGIGGMGIPIGKLSIYSACGGISPAYTLPITIDVGTDNEELLNNPMYMGKRHKRIRGQEYLDFVDLCLTSIHRRWPNAIIQFEDFAQHNATPLLKKYHDKLLCFNDDIQGTASVTVGTLIAACYAQHSKLSDHRIVFVGAGSAGCGIAEQLVAHMVDEGMTSEDAHNAIYLSNSQGLVHSTSVRLQDFQMDFAKTPEQLASWEKPSDYSLANIIKEAKPTILIGVSGRPGLITKEAVQYMASYCKQPIIMPLSNPTSKCEILPKDAINWTNGKAIVSTGSPFAPVVHDGITHHISQCNNAYIFPGLGLGVVSIKARRITDRMFMVASEALAKCSPMVSGTGPELLPALADIHSVSKRIAIEVAKQAIKDDVALPIPEEDIPEIIESNFWLPEYREYRRATI